MADVVPISKQNPVTNVKKHLRPISLTPTISKPAEDFVVSLHVYPAVLDVIDTNQFGGSSEVFYPVRTDIHAPPVDKGHWFRLCR